MRNIKTYSRGILIVLAAAFLPGCYLFKDTPDFVRGEPDGGMSASNVDGVEIELTMHGTIEFRDHIEDAVVSNGKMYILGSEELAIYDVSSPSAPTLLSGTSTDIVDGKDVGIYQNDLYILEERVVHGSSYTYYTALLKYDVSNPNIDPNSPVTKNFEIKYTDLNVKNGYAYMMEPTSIDVFDLSDGAKLVQGEVVTDGEYISYTIAGDLLFAKWRTTDYAQTVGFKVFRIGTDGLLTSIGDADIDAAFSKWYGGDGYLALLSSTDVRLYTVGAAGTLTEIVSSDAIDWEAVSKQILGFNHVLFDEGIVYLSTGDGIYILEVSGTSYTLLGISSASTRGTMHFDDTGVNDVLYVEGSSTIQILDVY